MKAECMVIPVDYLYWIELDGVRYYNTEYKYPTNYLRIFRNFEEIEVIGGQTA